jgi:hypothetical protein
MKIRLAVALVGLAIGFTAPTLAQQKDTVDPQIVQQIRALTIRYDAALNNHDAAAVAALYTQDGVNAFHQHLTVGRPSKNHTHTISSVGIPTTISLRSIG